MRAIRALIEQAADRIRVSRRGGALVFERGGVRIRVVDASRHIAVHFPAAHLLAGFRTRHPELGCGLRCVRIRDSHYLPLYELRAACEAAFGVACAEPDRGRAQRSAARAWK